MATPTAPVVIEMRYIVSRRDTQTPVWTAVPAPSFTQGTASSYSLSAISSDPLSRDITYTSVGAALPAGVTINNTTKVLAYNGTSPVASVASVRLRATAGSETADSALFTVTIAAAPAGIGFVQRPYFFQQDRTRLLASIAANEPQATGPSGNTIGQPLGFITMMNATLANRAANNDIAPWNLAVGGWLTGNVAMQDQAKNECLQLVRANPTGRAISGDDYQHIEDFAKNSALIVDCCYDRFTPSERDEVATYINGLLTYGEEQDATFWPFGDSHNNYWQNQHLAVTIGGICSEGWNTQAASWRAKANLRHQRMITQYAAPVWSGPQNTEGRYYSSYIRNSLWAMRNYDAVMGTNYLGQLSFTTDEALNHLLYMVRPHNGLHFHCGSEAAETLATYHSTVWPFWHQLIHLNPNSTNARVAKTILQSSAVTSGSNNTWARSSKAFDQFYWSFYSVSAAPLSTKTDRRLVLPTPGGASTFIRSAQGWDVSGTTRAAIMFHHTTDWNGATSPGYSHGNVDQPGFQWGQNAVWLVADPEFDSPSGIDAENGSSAVSDLSNIITLASSKIGLHGAYPVTLFNEDNTAATVPHYYTSINAQPYWAMCSTYRRQYVWLDDLQVVVICDRVTTSAANTKTFRLHFTGTTSIASNVATVTATGGATVRVRNLFSTSGTPMTATTNSPYNGISRLTQVDTANDFRSLKVLDVNGRCTAATLTNSSGTLDATLTINGVTRTVSFPDDGSHATIS